MVRPEDDLDLRAPWYLILATSLAHGFMVRNSAQLPVALKLSSGNRSPAGGQGRMTERSVNTLSAEEAHGRLELFKGSRECRLLSYWGLKILGRRKRLAASDWHDVFMSEAWNNPRYMMWRERMRTEALRAGLPEWIVEPRASSRTSISVRS